MNKKIYSKYLILNILLGLLSIVLVHFCKNPNMNMQQLLLYCFGGVDFTFEYLDITQIIVMLLPLILQLIFYMKILSYDLDRSCVYIFTRSKKRINWYLEKITFILISSLCFYLCLFLGATLWGYIFGIKISNFNQYLGVIFYLMLTVGLFNTVVIIICNIISILIKPSLVFLIIIILNIIQLFMVRLLYLFNGIQYIKLLPAVQGILSLHNIKFIRSVEISMGFIYKFTLSYSVIYCLILLCTFTALGGYIINKKDLY